LNEILGDVVPDRKVFEVAEGIVKDVQLERTMAE